MVINTNCQNIHGLALGILEHCLSPISLSYSTLQTCHSFSILINFLLCFLAFVGAASFTPRPPPHPFLQIPSGISKGESFLCLFQLLEDTCSPSAWLFFHPQSASLQALLQASHLLLDLQPFSLPLINAGDSLGPPGNSTIIFLSCDL